MSEEVKVGDEKKEVGETFATKGDLKDLEEELKSGVVVIATGHLTMINLLEKRVKFLEAVSVVLTGVLTGFIASWILGLI